MDDKLLLSKIFIKIYAYGRSTMFGLPTEDH